MKIVVFTAIQNNGGIMQFTYELTRTCIALGHEIVLYVPDKPGIIIPKDLISISRKYGMQKDILGIMPKMISVASSINSLKPDLFLCPDDCMYSIQVMRWVKSNIKKIMTIHDVSLHPGRKLDILRKILVFISLRIYRFEGFKRSDIILLLSENSKKRFSNLYPKYVKKVRMMLMGAHAPVDVIPRKPIEYNDNKPYLLYFGRIEKYKGISTLLKAFEVQESNKVNLIIAGNGNLEPDEVDLCKNNDRVYLINRYIDNDEMVWLFKNAMYAVLPYVEASQSGVLPIAYHYGIPVIVSNIEGLRELVIQGETGFIFNDQESLANILSELIHKGSTYSSSLSDACLKFESDNFDWIKNLKSVLSE